MITTFSPLQFLAQAAVVVEEDLHIDEGFELMVVGMGVVFTALVLIMILMIIIRAVVKMANKPKTAPALQPAPAASASTPAQSDDSGMDPQIAVLLTAAVAAVVKRPFRIRQVAQINRNTNAWAEHGRSVHHRSHRVRKGLK
jgi:sodium pump decarboxylase gamma subunit